VEGTIAYMAPERFESYIAPKATYIRSVWLFEAITSHEVASEKSTAGRPTVENPSGKPPTFQLRWSRLWRRIGAIEYEDNRKPDDTGGW